MKNKDLQDGKVEHEKRIIRLDDLDWEEEVVGGSAGKQRFGEQIAPDGPFGDSGGPRKP
jgi:hypothetical protein